MLAEAAIAGASAVAAAALTYLLGRRRESGDVSVSDAEELWGAARAMRAADRLRIDHLEEQLEREREEQQKMRHDLRKQILRLEIKTQTLERRLREMGSSTD